MRSPVTIPDAPAPGRYQVLGFVGGHQEEVSRWKHRHHAERHAALVLADGWSAQKGAAYSRVQVMDRFNRTVVYEKQKERKHYGR